MATLDPESTMMPVRTRSASEYLIDQVIDGEGNTNYTFNPEQATSEADLIEVEQTFHRQSDRHHHPRHRISSREMDSSHSRFSHRPAPLLEKRLEQQPPEVDADLLLKGAVSCAGLEEFSANSAKEISAPKSVSMAPTIESLEVSRESSLNSSPFLPGMKNETMELCKRCNLVAMHHLL